MAGILVTGHKGFIGSRLFKQLQEMVGDEMELYGLDIKNGKKEDILTCKLPKDIEIVFHLAAKPGVQASMADPVGAAHTNVVGTVRLLEAYPDAKFVFASSGGTIQEVGLESPYAVSKKACEDFIGTMHKDGVILRFPNVYGPGSRSVVDKWLNEKNPELYGDGNTYRIYCHIDDVIEGIVVAGTYPAGLYKMGTDDRHRVIDIAQAIGKPMKLVDAKDGDIQHTESELENTMLGWCSHSSVLEYIEDAKRNNS